MIKIVVSKVGPRNTIDIKVNVKDSDRVEAYKTHTSLASRVLLRQATGSVFKLPKEINWQEGDEVNVLINYPKLVMNL